MTEEVAAGDMAAEGFETLVSTTANPSVEMPPPPTITIINGAPRKQNVACDSCRSKKIKCQRNTVQERCEQCVAKGAECTSLYIEQLQTKVKKPRKRLAGNAGGSDEKRRRESDEERADGVPWHSLADQEWRTSKSEASQSGPWAEAESSKQGRERWSVESAQDTDRSLHLLANLAPAGTTSQPPTVLPHHLSASLQQANLLKYLFAPSAVKHHDWQYSDLDSLRICEENHCDLWEEMSGQVWAEEPSQAHRELPASDYNELAEDLIETFFSIAHIRFSLLDPATFRERYAQPDTHPRGPLSHALLAVAIAWGARFSENPLMIRDREEVSARDKEGPAGRSRCRISQLLVIRAREVAETSKVYRVPTVEGAQTLLLLEPLVAQAPYMKESGSDIFVHILRLTAVYQPASLSAAVKHMLQLGLNYPEGILSLSDETDKTAASAIWLNVSLSDGFRSAFHRLKPILSNADYELVPQKSKEHSTALSANEPEPASNGALRDPSQWSSAVDAGASLCRRLCEGLWTPRTRVAGIRSSVLREFVQENLAWRDKYLSRLGLPSKWPESWDFLAAITACSTDVYYHCLWLVVHHAVLEFGTEEMKRNGVQIKNGSEVDQLQEQIRNEAEHGALRIAALVAVLTQNGYLRLDPLILYYPIYAAGQFLAESARSECQACIKALRQYSIPYPQMWDLADELQRIYASAQSIHLAALPSLAAEHLTSVGSSETFSVEHDPAETSTALDQLTAIGSELNTAQDWASPRAASVLASSGYKSLPHARPSGEDGAVGPNVSEALFNWLQHS